MKLYNMSLVNVCRAEIYSDLQAELLILKLISINLAPFLLKLELYLSKEPSGSSYSVQNDNLH